jgi:hypothetical protein
MANQKTTELRTLTSQYVAHGDWLPIVDVSQLTSSPTGETKKISAADLAEYVVSGGFANFTIPQRGNQTSNGLSFAENYSPCGDLGMYCYGSAQNLGNEFTLSVRAFIPSDALLTDTDKRILFGVGSQVVGMSDSGSRAYIGVASSSLIAYVNDGTNEKIIEYVDFIKTYPDRVFEATITKDTSDIFKFYINGQIFGQVSSAPSYISSSYVTMGNGKDGCHWNINSVIYEAHVFNAAASETKVLQHFYGGVRSNDSTLVASYVPENLNPGPTQWLDSIGDGHMLLPRSGSQATSPTKHFNLIFFSDGTSGYLGDGTLRDVLPENYVLTDCFVYSPGKPLLSIGSTAAVAVPGDSGIYSFNNNRVPLVSASYGRNVLPLLELGVAHNDRSLYVFYSASAAPCTFSFQGYTSKYGVINYIPPSPTPTPTPTITITPSQALPTPTPTTTSTPTQTPPLAPGIYLSSNSFKLNDSSYVFTTDSTITSLPKWKLRVKATELTNVMPNQGLEQRATRTDAGFNTNYAPLDNPPVGKYKTELYYVEYDTTPDIYGNYNVLNVGPRTTVTMSVATASTFSPPPYPGNDVYLSTNTFGMNNPAYVYTGNSSVLSSYRYKLRCKIAGTVGTELTAAFGSDSQQRSVAWDNNYSEIIPPGVGIWPAELYWVTYDSGYTATVQSAPWQVATMSIATASGFTPVTPPPYTASNHPNVYLSGSTGTTLTFKYSNPPYIYCTDSSVLSSPYYRLRCKALTYYTSSATWGALPGGTEQRAIAWNNQYQTIFPPEPGVYRFELYWITYPAGPFSTAGATLYTGSAYSIDVTITP